MSAVRRQEAEDASSYPVGAPLRQMSSKDRGSEGAAVIKLPVSGGDRARDHESGSVKRKRAQNPSLDSSHDAESSAGDGSSSSSISSALECRVGNDLTCTKFCA